MVSVGPTVEGAVEAVCKLLSSHGHSKACFVAHSLGTVLLAWMLHSDTGQRISLYFFC